MGVTLSVVLVVVRGVETAKVVGKSRYAEDDRRESKVFGVVAENTFGDERKGLQVKWEK